MVFYRKISSTVLVLVQRFFRDFFGSTVFWFNSFFRRDSAGNFLGVFLMFCDGFSSFLTTLELLGLNIWVVFIIKSRCNNLDNRCTSSKTVVPNSRTVVPIFRTVEPISRTVVPISRSVVSIFRTVVTIFRTVVPICKTVVPISRTVEPISRSVVPILEPLYQFPKPFDS